MLSVPQSLADIVRYWSRYRPTAVAIHFQGRDITWAEFDGKTDQIANGLLKAGLRHREAVGILMRNRPEFLEAVIGTLKAGGFVTPLNIRFTAAEHDYPLADAGVRFVISEPHFGDVLDQVLESNPHITAYLTEPRHGYRTVDGDLLPAGQAPLIDLTWDDTAFLFYTSGTTGTPKGVEVTHGTARASALALALADGVTWRDRTLVAIPLAFTGGMNTWIRESLVCGSTTILTQDYDAESVLELVARQRVTVWASVPVIFEQILNSPNFARRNLSSLWLVRAAGATITHNLLKGWQERGISLSQGYGLTECSGGYLCILNPDEAERKLGSAGRPILHTEVFIADEDDQPLEPGEGGQVLARGPSIMKGYWHQPQATAETLKGGWLHTGDIATMDEEGFIRLIDRKKDMVISGGLNVYPAEIERVLAGLPGLEELAVIGVPDPRWGEVPALVVADSSRVDMSGLRSMCTTQLADYKRPKYVISHDGPLPRTMSGKIQKNELRTRYIEVPATALLLKEPSARTNS